MRIASAFSPQDLEKIADLTLDYYNQHAEDFWEGTRNHDVSQNIAAMLRYIQGERPFTILDFGCGPGRDLKAFVELGHLATGLEGAAHLAAMARAYSGSPGWQAYGVGSRADDVCLLARRGYDAMSAYDPKRTLACDALGIPSSGTILPYHPLLASPADSEGRLQARLTARSQRAPPRGHHQRMTQASPSVAVSEGLEALAGRP